MEDTRQHAVKINASQLLTLKYPQDGRPGPTELGFERYRPLLRTCSRLRDKRLDGRCWERRNPRRLIRKSLLVVATSLRCRVVHQRTGWNCSPAVQVHAAFFPPLLPVIVLLP